jgi:hypothetical protein
MFAGSACKTVDFHCKSLLANVVLYHLNEAHSNGLFRIAQLCLTQ